MVQLKTIDEPTVDELLSDPIAWMIMERDGLRPEVVWACVRDARRKLKSRGREEAGNESATS